MITGYRPVAGIDSNRLSRLERGLRSYWMPVLAARRQPHDQDYGRLSRDEDVPFTMTCQP